MIKAIRFFSTSPCINNIKTTRQQYTMLNKLLDRGSKKVLKAISNQNYLSQPVIAKEGKYYPVQESRRQIVLNKLLLEHLCDLMASGEISHLLAGYGLEITTVETSRNFATVKVFWCCNEKSDANEIQRILDANASKLRSELIKQHILGTIPYIQFFYDKTRKAKQRVFNLLDKIKVEINSETDLVPSHWRQIPVIKTDKIQPTISYETKDVGSIELGEMTHDIYGLDRAALVKLVIERCTKRKEINQSQVKKAYPSKQSIYMDGDKHFEKFLKDRRKNKSSKTKYANELQVMESNFDQDDFYNEDMDDELYDEDDVRY